MAAINEVITKGNAYRVCIDQSDPTNLKWERKSWWTSAEDVVCNDEMSVEEKIGSFKGFANGSGAGSGFIYDAEYLSQNLNGCLRIDSFDAETGTLHLTSVSL